MKEWFVRLKGSSQKPIDKMEDDEIEDITV